MIRARFYCNGEDYRPVKWPIKHPYWCSGYSGDLEKAVIVGYFDDEAAIYELWPDAEDVEVSEVSAYQFTERFPKPEWMTGPVP